MLIKRGLLERKDLNMVNIKGIFIYCLYLNKRNFDYLFFV